MGAELEPRPRSQSTMPSPRCARRTAFQPILLPGPSGAPYPLSPGAPDLPGRTHQLPGPGSASGRSPLPQPQPQPPPAEAAVKFARGLALSCLGPAREAPPGSLPRLPLPRPLSAALQHRPGSGCRRTAPCARRAGSPRSARAAALGVYRGPAARSPRPPPCALLTSFILSHPCPPTPFPNSDSPGGARSRCCGSPGAERSSKNRCDFLRSEPSAAALCSQPLKVQGRRGLAGGADWLSGERLERTSLNGDREQSGKVLTVPLPATFKGGAGKRSPHTRTLPFSETAS